MASLTPISQYCHSIPFQTPLNHHLINSSSFISDSNKYFNHKTGSVWFRYSHHVLPMRAAYDNVPAMTAADQKKKMRKKATGFVEELRSTALRLHTKEQVKEGEKEIKAPHERHLAKWEPTFEGYLRFLVDSKLVYDTL